MIKIDLNTYKHIKCLLIATPEMADDPAISNRLEAAFSYVGGRADTLFSGVYVRSKLPGLIALTLLGGM